ncbi:hypothetical protein J6590_035986 [Homalodisca vitripennis]|nr:hypothetical protein J6590_035986 [Homalodisca vitripennis]
MLPRLYTMQFSRQLIVLVVCACVAAVEELPANPIVQIAQGKLRGRIVNSWSGKKIISFIGVRFAEPPTGINRFQPPVPVKPWTEVRNATEDGPLCPIPGRNDTSEDCLFLCVHTKNLSGRQPVIIYFHPGGFAGGTGNYRYTGPQYLLDHDVVLVSFNYRNGPLGFLSTGDEVLPGNYGLKDQLLVMKWVRQNIAHFGGDPLSVTLFGYSAGGGSVQLHMLSPLSRGLFHRAISSSCSATTAAVLNRDPLTLARRFANLLNCSTETSQQIRDCLLSLPEAAITAARTRIWIAQ